MIFKDTPFEYASAVYRPEPFMVNFNPSQGYSSMQEFGWTSLYIPQVPANLHLVEYKLNETASHTGEELNYLRSVYNIESEAGMKYLFETVLGFGSVKRVDFIVRNGLRRAFVHFQQWSKTNDRADQARDMIERIGSVKLAYIRSNWTNYYSFTTSPMDIKQDGCGLFIHLKRNFKEIPEVKEEDVPQNIHQIVQWNKDLAAENATLTQRVAELEKELLELKNQTVSI